MDSRPCKEEKDPTCGYDAEDAPRPAPTSSYGPREDLVFTPSTYLGITKCCFCIDHRGGFLWLNLFFMIFTMVLG